jgi:hypothetical protein
VNKNSSSNPSENTNKAPSANSKPTTGLKSSKLTAPKATKPSPKSTQNPSTSTKPAPKPQSVSSNSPPVSEKTKKELKSFGQGRLFDFLKTIDQSKFHGRRMLQNLRGLFLQGRKLGRKSRKAKRKARKAKRKAKKKAKKAKKKAKKAKKKAEKKAKKKAKKAKKKAKKAKRKAERKKKGGLLKRVGKGIGKAAKKVGKGIGNTAKKVGKGVANAGKAVGKAAKTVANKFKGAFRKLTKREKRKTIEEVIDGINDLIKNMNVEKKKKRIRVFGRKKAKKIRQLRQSLLNGVEKDFQPAERRCEKKFGKGNCIKMGEFSFVYRCDKGKAPVWASKKKKKKFKCKQPKSMSEMREMERFISKKKRKDYNGKYEAFFYEILDG